jgi:hypothetical protein
LDKLLVGVLLIFCRHRLWEQGLHGPANVSTSDHGYFLLNIPFTFLWYEIFLPIRINFLPEKLTMGPIIRLLPTEILIGTVENPVDSLVGLRRLWKICRVRPTETGNFWR